MESIDEELALGKEFVADTLGTVEAAHDRSRQRHRFNILGGVRLVLHVRNVRRVDPAGSSAEACKQICAPFDAKEPRIIQTKCAAASLETCVDVVLDRPSEPT